MVGRTKADANGDENVVVAGSTIGLGGNLVFDWSDSAECMAGADMMAEKVAAIGCSDSVDDGEDEDVGCSTICADDSIGAVVDDGDDVGLTAASSGRGCSAGD
jgi:hypothetical protein